RMHWRQVIWAFVIAGGALGAVLLLSTPAYADVKAWTGGVSGAWSNPNNWQGAVAPAPGDDLVFPASAANKTNTNDYPAGTFFSSLTFTGNGYTIGGNGITLANGITQYYDSAVTSSISTPL